MVLSQANNQRAFYMEVMLFLSRNGSNSDMVRRNDHIHIGRSQFVFGAYTAGFGMGKVPWDARACIVGHGIQITFEPLFYDGTKSNKSRKRRQEDDSGGTSAKTQKTSMEVPQPPIGKAKKSLNAPDIVGGSSNSNKDAESIVNTAATTSVYSGDSVSVDNSSNESLKSKLKSKVAKVKSTDSQFHQDGSSESSSTNDRDNKQTAA